MKFVDKIGRMLASVTKPLNSYGAFVVFMFVLGLVAVYAVVPAKRGHHAYALAPEELFVDVCLLCLLLWIIPRKVGLWLKRAMYVVAYLVALVDVYCFVKFDTTITPTMLLLVGETNSDEAAEFVESYMTFGIVFSRVGRVLLVMLVHVLWAVVYYRVNKLRLMPLSTCLLVPCLLQDHGSVLPFLLHLYIASLQAGPTSRRMSG